MSILEQYAGFVDRDWFPFELDKFQGISYFVEEEGGEKISDNMAILAIRGAAIEYLHRCEWSAFEYGGEWEVWDNREGYKYCPFPDEAYDTIDEAIIAALKEVEK